MNRQFISWLELLEPYTLSCQVTPSVISGFRKQSLLHRLQPSDSMRGPYDCICHLVLPHGRTGLENTEEPKCFVVIEPEDLTYVRT